MLLLRGVWLIQHVGTCVSRPLTDTCKHAGSRGWLATQQQTGYDNFAPAGDMGLVCMWDVVPGTTVHVSCVIKAHDLAAAQAITHCSVRGVYVHAPPAG